MTQRQIKNINISLQHQNELFAQLRAIHQIKTIRLLIRATDIWHKYFLHNQ